MVVSPAFSPQEASALAPVAAGRAAIGLHLTLTAPFRPLTQGFRPLAADGAFLSLAGAFARGLLRRLGADVLRREAAAQIVAFTEAFGRPPDFVDGHQHVHLLPQVTDALLASMKDGALSAWIRQCGRSRPRWSDAKGHLLDALSARLRRRCAESNFRTNPGFAGTYEFRRERAYEPLFVGFLQGLPDGGIVMCHPGFVDAQLERIDSMTLMREREYEFFAGDRFPELMARHGLGLA
jgi:chitin disaccharide deacetylase